MSDPRARPPSAALPALAMLATAASAPQVQIHPRIERIDPSAKVHLPADRLLKIATFPDGGYVATINGLRVKPMLHPGMRLIIAGAGFGAQAPRSLVGVMPSGAGTGIIVHIISWSDTEIVGTIDTGRHALPGNPDDARLLIQAVRPDRFERTYEIRGFRFRPS